MPECYDGDGCRNLSPCIRAWEAELKRRGLSSQSRIWGIAHTKASRGLWPPGAKK